MEINKNIEFEINGYVLKTRPDKNLEMGIITDRQENDKEIERWGKYWYEITWQKTCISDGPWSIPDFETGYLVYLGNNFDLKTVEILYGYKEV